MATFTPDAGQATFTPGASFTPDASEPSGGKYDHGSLRKLWLDAGGDPGAADLMAHVALAESAGNPAAANQYTQNGRTYHVNGLWQISDINGAANYDDPMTAARKAVELYRTQGMAPWADSRDKGAGGGWGQYASPSGVISFTPDTPARPDPLQPAKDFARTLTRPIVQPATADTLFTPDAPKQQQATFTPAGTGLNLPPPAPTRSTDTATHVDTPKNARPNPLREAAAVLEVPMEALGAGAQTRSGKPEFGAWWNLLKQGKFSEAQRLFSPFEDEQVLRYAKNNPDDPLAQILAKHPVARGIGTFIGEWANPAYWGAGKAAEGVLWGLGAASKAARSVPAIDKAATAVGNATVGPQGVVTHFTAPLAHAAQQVVAPLSNAIARGRGAAVSGLLAAARGLGAASRGGSFGAAARNFFDRYYASGLPQRGGAAFEGQALRMQAAADHAEGQVRNRIAAAGKGLTQAQKIEVQKLMYANDDGNVLHVPDPNAPPVPEPRSGPSLAARAADMRSLRAETDAIQSALSIRDTKKNPLLSTGLYFPMRTFARVGGKIDPATGQLERVPVFKSQDLSEAAGKGEDALLATLRARGGSRRFSGVAQSTGRKQDPLATILNPEIEADLHPRYDPFFQLGEHYGDTHRAIANEITRRELEHLPSIDPATGAQRTYKAMVKGTTGVETPATARVPVQYYVDTDDGRLIFGQGEAGKKSRDRYIEREAQGKGAVRARSDPAMRAFAQARGIAPSALGTRGVVSRGTMPAFARLQESKRLAAFYKGAFSRLVKKANASDAKSRAAAALAAQRVARDVRFNAEKLGSVADANTAAQVKAASDARDYRISAEALDDELETAKAAFTPARRLAAQIQRELWNADMEHFAPIDAALRGGLRPSWVWQNGKWKIAGEYVDIPKRYLNLTEKPKNPPVETQGLVARVESKDFDDVATQLGFASEGDLREWMAAHPTPPRLSDYADAAVRRAAQSPQIDESQIPDLKKYADHARSEIARLDREAGERKFAASEFGPAVEGVRSAAERAQKNLGDVADTFGQAAQIAKFDATQGGLEKAAAKRIATATAAYNRATAVKQTAREFKKVSARYYKEVRDEIAESIKAKSAHAPDAGYVLESTVPGLESPSRGDMAIDKSFAEFARSQEKLRKEDVPEAKAVWESMQMLNRLSRMSVVLEPWVHGINNEGMHYVAEGGLPETMAQIIAGKYEPGRYDKAGNFTRDPLMASRAAAAGAATERAERNFAGVAEPNATTSIAERARWAGEDAAAKFGPLGRVAEPLRQAQLRGGQVYNAFNHWLFGKVEHDYAMDLFARKVGIEGKSDAQAAFEVRNALGRNDNLSPRELAWNLNKIFYFYPWMKTVVSYWARKGVIDPKWWAAPVRAIQANNEGQGYDDPSKPFTATLGTRADGQFRRVILPLPQRVTENIAEAARVPLDVAENVAGARPVGDTLADAAAPFKYIAGHFNPALELGGELLDAGNEARQGRTPAPYNTFYADPYATPQQQGASILSRIAGRAIAPLGRGEDGGGDPLGSLAAYGVGAFSYGTKTPMQAAIEKKVREDFARIASKPFAKAIHAATLAGDGAQLQALNAAVKQQRMRLKAAEDAAVTRALAAQAGR